MLIKTFRQLINIVKTKYSFYYLAIMEKGFKENLSEIIKDPNLSDSEVSEALRNTIDNYYSDNYENFGSVKRYSELARQEYKDYVNEPNNKKTIKTGFNQLDKLIGGLSKGDYIVLGGRISMGKTLVLTSIARNISKNNACLYFTFDTSPGDIANKLLSGLADQDSKNIYSSMKSNWGVKSEEKFNELDYYKIFISDSYRNSVKSLYNCCKKYKYEHNIEVVFVDYIQAMESDHTIDQNTELSYLSRNLKKIAKELDLCVIVSSQLNRALIHRGGDYRPIISDIRGSSALEQDADKVILIHRPDYYGFKFNSNGKSLIGKFELILAKNNKGFLGSAFFTQKQNSYAINEIDGSFFT